jgi:hypothetical protein
MFRVRAPCLGNRKNLEFSSVLVEQIGPEFVVSQAVRVDKSHLHIIYMRPYFFAASAQV